MATEGSSHPRLERFDGSEPAAYKRWRRRASLMLISLPSTYPSEKLGPKLMEFIVGEAELAVEHVPVEDLAKAGGEQLVFKALDDRYKPLEKDDMNEALTDYFVNITIKSGETMKAFTTRLATAHRKLGEHSVTLPKEVQGWFLLRKMRVDSSQEAMLLTATGGSYQIDKIEKAVKAVLPNAKGTSRPSKDSYVTDETGVLSDDTEGDDAEVLQVLVTDMQEAGEEYDEENMLEVFETYKQVRSRVMEAKKIRGYRPLPTKDKEKGPWRLTGSISAKLDQVRARTRCHRCNQIGHWKRECPQKPRGSGQQAAGSHTAYRATATSGGGSKEVHIVAFQNAA